MPWSAWWQTVSTGDLWPLGVAVAFRAGYYFVGIGRMLAGYGPWGCGPDEPDVPSPDDRGA